MGRSAWENLRLGELGELRNGVNFNRHQEGRGLPVLKVKDFGTRVFAPVDDLDELDPSSIDVPKNQLLEGGDIVIIRSNGNSELVGRSVLFRGSERPVTFSGFCIRFRPNKTRIDPRFAAYLIRSPFFRNRFSAFGSGTGIQNLSQGILAEMPVLLPAISEQKHIASVLGSLDDKIDLNRRMNETLEAMARAIFKSWFVDFDPVRAKIEGRQPVGMDAETAGLFPRSLEDSILGPIPKGWSVVPFLDVVDLLSGGTPSTTNPEYWGGTIPWASAKDVSQCGETFLIETERSITQTGLQNSATKIMPALTTVVVARGATTGRFTMFGADIAMNQTCYGLRSKNAQHYFLNCLFHQSVGQLVHSAHGSVFDTITTATFQNALVMRPPVSVCSSFDTCVGPLFKHILSTLRESRILAQLRDSILPRLLSGEIPLKDAEKTVEAHL